MDINGWLTVVSVFLALIAFLPQHERRLLQLTLSKSELVIILFILVVIIPYLLLFKKLETRIKWLSNFTFSHGIEHENIAFGLFYLLFVWILLRFLTLLPKGKMTPKVVNYFVSILDELPFPQFYSLFRKYSVTPTNSSEWELYRYLILQPAFINGIQRYHPNFIFTFLQQVSSKNDLKIMILPLLRDQTSIYYLDIKYNDGNNSVSPNSIFLYSLIVTHLDKTLSLGLRELISDSAKIHLRSERGRKNSLYMQEHLYGHVEGEEGYDLPLFYHIRCIDLIYCTAIKGKLNLKGNMHTIYGGMVAEVINNLDTVENYEDREFPTNYHWLISEIFNSIGNWLEIYGKKHFADIEKDDDELIYKYYSEQSNLTDFIPSCFHFTINELYKGYQENKIKLNFIAKMFHYHLFSYYFDHEAHPDILTSIETNVIRNIPKDLIPEIFDKTLDEHFAGSYNRFIERRFSGNEIEVRMQARLHKYYASIL